MDMKSNLIVVRNCEQDLLRHFLMEDFPLNDSGGLPIDKAAKFNHIEVVWILIEEGRGSTIRIRTMWSERVHKPLKIQQGKVLKSIHRSQCSSNFQKKQMSPICQMFA